MFADGAIQVRSAATGPCSQQSPCVGRPDILLSQRETVANHQCITILDETVDGNVLIAHEDVRNDTSRAAGVELQIIYTMSQVADGRIVARYGLSDPTASQRQAGPITNPATPCSNVE
jgi:hypothetical protein